MSMMRNLTAARRAEQWNRDHPGLFSVGPAMPRPTMSHEAWCSRYRARQELAQQFHATCQRLVEYLCLRAHVEPGCALHNCMVALGQGKPWREVDYEYATAALAVHNMANDPGMAVRDWDLTVSRFVGFPEANDNYAELDRDARDRAEESRGR